MDLVANDLKKMTKKSLALKIGISVACLNRYLAGVRTPKTVKAIAAYYNITITEVL